MCLLTKQDINTINNTICTLLGSRVSRDASSHLIDRHGRVAASAGLQTKLGLNGVHNSLNLNGIESQIAGEVGDGGDLEG